jgi:hypothetical protein
MRIQMKVQTVHTNVPTQELLQRLVRVGPRLINSRAKPGPHCVLATSVGQMTLARVGIQAEPYPVQLTVCNRAWKDWVAAGAPGGREEQLRRGAYVITNAPDWQGASFMTIRSAKPWDGHLVLRVPDGERSWLVDLDVGSFRRPRQQIHVPLGLVAPLSNGSVTGTCTMNGVETTVEYAPLDAPYRDDYLTARDWVERDRFEPEVAKLVRLITA